MVAPLNSALAAAATLVSIAFTLSTLDRWLRRRKPHELAWTISLALFSIGSGALWWAETNGWSVVSFRLFYLAGAVLNVPWLALGTVYLLGDARIGRRIQQFLVAFTWFSVGVVLFVPIETSVSGPELPTGKAVFGAMPRILAAAGSGVSALVIIIGALWSAFAVISRHTDTASTADSAKRLAVGNVLVAAGTVVLSASGSLAGRLGKDRSFVITLLIGIGILFAGFLVSPSSRQRPPAHGDEIRPVTGATASR